MATEAKPASPEYTVGRRVEVRVFHFAIDRTRTVWTCGTVTAVEPTDPGCWEVEVARDNGKPFWQLVDGDDGDDRIRAL